MLLASRSRCRSGCTRAMISQRERRQLEQQVEKEETDGRLGKGKGVCEAQEKGKGVCGAQEAQTCSKDGYERMHTNSRELLQRFQNETANWFQKREETPGNTTAPTHAEERAAHSVPAPTKIAVIAFGCIQNRIWTPKKRACSMGRLERMWNTTM